MASGQPSSGVRVRAEHWTPSPSWRPSLSLSGRGPAPRRLRVCVRVSAALGPIVDDRGELNERFSDYKLGVTGHLETLEQPWQSL